MAQKKTDQQPPLDMSSLFGNFDPNKMIQDFASNLSSMKAPEFDLQAVVEAQRKNVEALTAANRQAVEGAQAIAERQRQILQQAISEATDMAKDMFRGGGTPQETASAQMAAMQQAFEKAFATMRELAEMTAKTNQETFDILNKRFQESLAELRTATKKSG